MIVPLSPDEFIQINPFMVKQIGVYTQDFVDSTEIVYYVLIDTDDNRYESPLFKRQEGARVLAHKIAERITKAIEERED